MMKWILAALIVLVLIAGCGTFKCDCGDGRMFSMSATENSGTLAANCNAFCGAPK